MLRKIKEQQEAEDEALARKLYQEEVQRKQGGQTPSPISSSAAPALSSSSSAKDALAEANALRLSRQSDLLKRKEPTPAPAASSSSSAAPVPLPLKPIPKYFVTHSNKKHSLVSEVIFLLL